MDKNEYQQKVMEKKVTGMYQLAQYNPMIDAKERTAIVGRNLLMLRKKAGLQQKEVAEIIDCKPQTYSGYETGRHEPNIETLVRLASLYNVSVDYIVGMFDDADEDTQIYAEIHNEIRNPKFQEIQIQMQLIRDEIAALKKQIEK